MEKLDIKIQYDGEYPCLCMGHLIVWIDGKEWDFGKYALESGGRCILADDRIVKGKWNIFDDKWPKEFPEKYKRPVLSKINKEIPHGCCGGCF